MSEEPTGKPPLEFPEQGAPALTNKQRMTIHRHAMPELGAEAATRSFEEVALGYALHDAREEALRCLQCKKPTCVQSCPMQTDIPGFIKKTSEGDLVGAYQILVANNLMCSICSRVCPQEQQCEGGCSLIKAKTDSVAIGNLERFVADWGHEHLAAPRLDGAPRTGKRVAVVGAGPAGLTAAGDLVRLGHHVTVFEAMPRAGGALVYAIPEYRLPSALVEEVVKELTDSGVELRLNVQVGKTVTLGELREEFNATFIASGADEPFFMGVPGERLGGVITATEYLTRVRAHEFGEAELPHLQGDILVVGGGNVAMDAARTARRLGTGRVYIGYRRSLEEMPARHEEIVHAQREGVEILFLHNPLRYEPDAEGQVNAAVLERMKLGEADAKGRRRPEPTGELRTLDVSSVIVAIGYGPNTVIPSTAPKLRVRDGGNVMVEPTTGKTTLPWVWAGGDVVFGASTVVRAMAGGRLVARSIHEALVNDAWLAPAAVE